MNSLNNTGGLGAAAARTLAPHHRRLLEQGSGIAAEVIEERGYWSALRWPELQGLPFRGSQKRKGSFPALVIPQYGPDGEYTYSVLRYDSPPLVKGKPMKYVQPAGVGLRIDIPPRCHDGLWNTDDPIWWTEGAKKADALASRGCVAVNTPGVDGWRSPASIPDLFGIPLKGRHVICAYDEDVLTKRTVHLAVIALARWMDQRGAHVQVLDWTRVIGKQ